MGKIHWTHNLAFLFLLFSLIWGCGGGDGGSSSGGGGGVDPTVQAQSDINALKQPDRTLGVNCFTDNYNLPVVAQSLYPEVQSLINLQSGSTTALLKVLTDPTLDGSEDGDTVRALAAFILEDTRAYSAVEPLSNYVRRAFNEIHPLPFFSIQAGMHAWAVLSGRNDLVLSLYDYDTVAAFVASSPSASQGSVLKHILTTSNNNANIPHVHQIGDPNWYPRVFTAEEAADYDNKFRKLTNEWKFEDDVRILAGSDPSFDCKTWALRKDDTTLPDPRDRYSIYPDGAEAILQNEGYQNITAFPTRWAYGDVVIFRRNRDRAIVHAGRISLLGTSLLDPNFRYTSKWSVVFPTVDTTIRDTLKLYKDCTVEIWGQRSVAECEWIAGNWTVFQTTTTSCTDLTTGLKDDDYNEASGNISITQIGCSINDSSGELSGTIDGTTCHFSTAAYLYSMGFGKVDVPLTGTISFRKIPLHGTATVSTVDRSCFVEANVVLTR
jgi:hypothetical protein